ncbi:MAG: nucleoside triphosphate pyrophosphohydrolase [Acutalibacteraceae bacterium]|nr:nucleoside triphosphate pyrophosphohydrolase [Acutalibacteraceae bacterium]
MWYNKEKYTFDDFKKIIEILRSPEGCPWDREQTHNTIRNEFIEETYEAVDAIDRGDKTDLCEELGDVLLQIMLHSQIADENGDFNVEDVIDGVAKKMVLRHPHVFGDVSVENSAQVLENWDKIKKTEKHQTSYTDTLKSVPMSYPALMRAQKIQKRAGKVGFDFESIEAPLQKLNEEHAELLEAIATGDKEKITEEYGDLLFTMVNISRFLKIDSEEALQKASDKFIKRFEAVEDAADKKGKDMKEMSLKELDALWDDVKK